MYPPGQFAAWNRGQGGQSRHGTAIRRGGPEQDRQSRQAEPHGPGRPTGSGYYSRGSDPDSEPGYSMLAVSDPAADVTSTQTWRAMDDGRATGTWTVPARDLDAASPAGQAAGGPPATAGRSGAHARPDGGQAQSGPDDALPLGRRLAPWSPQAAAQRAADLDHTHRADTVTGAASRADLAAPGGRAAAAAPGSPAANGRSDHLVPSAGQEPGESLTGERQARDASAGLAAAHGREATGPGGREATRAAGRAGGRRTYPVSVKMAVAGAVVLVLGAVAALYFGARAFSGSGHPAGKPKSTAKAAAVPTPTLGPYGHIGTRQSDPVPLTIAQLYPVSVVAAGDTYVQTDSKLSADCIDAVSGAGIQAAVSSAGCSQVARATYLDAATGMMGTIGVLNLRSAAAAIRAERAAGANNFIAQLPGRSGPTHKLGQGTGIEEAAAKGHYLILIWAEFTDLRTPRTAAQRSELEQFMTGLLQGTANVSLSNRMVSGSPS